MLLRAWCALHPSLPPPQDFICNHVGNRQWVDVLPWHDASRWALAADQSWEVEGGEAGTVKQVGPMSFVTVFQAGHMVGGAGRGGVGCRGCQCCQEPALPVQSEQCLTIATLVVDHSCL